MAENKTDIAFTPKIITTEDISNLNVVDGSFIIDLDENNNSGKLYVDYSGKRHPCGGGDGNISEEKEIYIGDTSSGQLPSGTKMAINPNQVSETLQVPENASELTATDPTTQRSTSIQVVLNSLNDRIGSGGGSPGEGGTGNKQVIFPVTRDGFGKIQLKSSLFLSMFEDLKRNILIVLKEGSDLFYPVYFRDSSTDNPTQVIYFKNINVSQSTNCSKEQNINIRYDPNTSEIKVEENLSSTSKISFSSTRPETLELNEICLVYDEATPTTTV